MFPIARKGSLLTVVLALAVFAPAHAQIAHKYFGLTGGATYGNITDYALVNTDWRWGGTAGILAGVVTSDHSFWEVMPSWTQMGGGDVRLDYVDIPVNGGVLLPLGDGNTLLRGYLGVTLSLKVSCASDLADVCDAARGTFWALPVGLSVARVLGNGRFVGINASYSPFPLYDAFDGYKSTQRSWQFRAMYAVPLGGG